MKRNISLMILTLSASLCAPVFAQDSLSDRALWTFQTGGEIWSSPVADAGVVYFGSDDSHLYALASDTGLERWRFNAGAPVRSRPALDSAAVYISADSGYLFAVSRDTGHERWHADVGVETASQLKARSQWDYLQSSPAVADGMVFVGSLDTYIYALETQTGAERWRFKTEMPVRSSPAVADGIVYVGSWDGLVYALDAQTGTERWRFDTQGNVQPSPTIVDHIVYIGSRHPYLYALDAANGTELWRCSYGRSWVESSAAVVDGVVYVGSSDALRLFALDAATGATVWEYITNGYAWSSPAVTSHGVYIGSIGVLHGYLHAVDRQTGQELWRIETGKALKYNYRGVVSSPAAANGVVYFGGLDGKLYAVMQ